MCEAKVSPSMRAEISQTGFGFLFSIARFLAPSFLCT